MRRFFGLMLLAVSVCGTMDSARVEAGTLVAKMGGITGNGSGSQSPISTLAGVPFAGGLAWTLEVEFDPATMVVSGNSSGGTPISQRLDLGGTSYTITPGDETIEFAQIPSIGYVIFLGGSRGTISMFFQTASTPNWSPTSPTPTNFSDFFDFGAQVFLFTTNQGQLLLRHGKLLSPTAEIVGGAPAVPEPSVIGLAVCGSVCGFVVARRRRN